MDRSKVLYHLGIAFICLFSAAHQQITQMDFTSSIISCVFLSIVWKHLFEKG